MIARYQRHGVFFHQRLGCGLGTHRVNAFGLGPDEGDAGVGAGAGEAGVLGQEAVTGVDGLRAGLFRHIQDHVAAQVRVGRARATDRPGLVGQPHVLRILVRFRIHRDGVDAEATAGADHATGDLAAVGYQYAFEHAGSLKPFVSMQSYSN